MRACASILVATLGAAAPALAQECPPGYRVLIGTPGDDHLSGGNGRDCILGLGGNDVISGGNGEDLIFAGPGDDVVDGGNGDDELHGGPGDDRLSGGRGTDRIFGEAGDDAIHGGQGGGATIEGGEGDDLVRFEAGGNTVRGGPGDDVLAGPASGNLVDGGPGTDACARGCELPLDVTPCGAGKGTIACPGGTSCDPTALVCAGASPEGGRCGDGVLQRELGEECDDGGRAPQDGCNHLCRREVCGDGVVQFGIGEQCEGLVDCAACKRPCIEGTDLGSALGLGVASGLVGAVDRTSGTCGGRGRGDVSFTWTAPFAGRFTFDTYGSQVDTVLHVHDGACSGPELACSDDAVGRRSSVSLTLAAGRRVVAAIDGDPGPFVLNVSGPCALDAPGSAGLGGDFPLAFTGYDDGLAGALDAAAGRLALSATGGLASAVVRGPAGDLFTCVEDLGVVVHTGASGASSIHAAGLAGCTGLLPGPGGTLFASETYGGRVVAIDPGGGVSDVATGLFTPMHLAYDRDGSILVAELHGGRVSRIGAGGVVTTAADGLERPVGLAVGVDDKLYVSTPFSAIGLTAIDRCGARSIVSDDLAAPSGLAAHRDGRLFVAEPRRGRVSVLDLVTGAMAPFTSGLASPAALAFGGP